MKPSGAVGCVLTPNANIAMVCSYNFPPSIHNWVIISVRTNKLAWDATDMSRKLFVNTLGRVNLAKKLHFPSNNDLPLSCVVCSRAQEMLWPCTAAIQSCLPKKRQRSLDLAQDKKPSVAMDVSVHCKVGFLWKSQPWSSLTCDAHQNGTVGWDQGLHSSWENCLGTDSLFIQFLMWPWLLHFHFSDNRPKLLRVWVSAQSCPSMGPWQMCNL